MPSIGQVPYRHLTVEAAKILMVSAALYAAVVAWPRVIGGDSHAYWLTRDGISYGLEPATTDAYLYSPVFAQLIKVITLLPWDVFLVAWSTMLGLVLAWLLLPLKWWAIPLWTAGLPEILSGNIFILLAAATVASITRPGAWAFAALTKLSVCLGPVWYAVRFEWRGLAASLGVTAFVGAVSWTVAPDAWAEWIRFLFLQAAESRDPLGASFWPPFLHRAPIAVMLAAVAAYLGRPRLLPIAMLVATPVLWLGAFTLLAAMPRLPPHERPGVSPPESLARVRARTRIEGR